MMNIEGGASFSSLVFCRLGKACLAALFCLALCLSQPPAVTAALSRGVAGLPAYIVRKGDTLYGIGRRFGLSVALLKSFNGLRSDLLKPGQRLLLEPRATAPVPPDAPAVSGLWGVVEGFLATPYRFGGTGSDGIDCSSFVQQVFRFFNIALPRSAREQYCYGEEVDRSELRSGDLLFFHTYAQYPSHVGIYLGDGKMVHASASSRRVVASDIGLPYFRKRFIGARRLAAFALEPLDPAALDLVNEVPVEQETSLSGENLEGGRDDDGGWR